MRAQLAVDRVGDLRLERARHLVAADLEPGDSVVMPDAADAEAKVAQHVLGPLDHPELVFRDLREVRNARRQTSRRGLVPGRQAGLARQLADLILRQPDLVERAPDAELTRGLPPRPVVAAVVRVAAVGDDGNAALTADRREVRIELVLAEVAAVRGIGAIVGARRFVGGDELVLKAEVRRDRQRESRDDVQGSWDCWR